MPCIFCGADTKLTDEHVFPAFIGASLVISEGSCEKCNSECSRFEGVIAAQTKTARHIFEIPNRYGRIPNAPVNVEIQGEGLENIAGRFHRTPDGEIHLHDFIKETKTEEGKRIRDGFFVSREAAERFIEGSHERGDKVTELDVPKEITLLSSSEQTIQFAFFPEMRRMVAKTALTSLARVYGVEYARHRQFDLLRHAIFSSSDELPLRIFANNDFANDHIRTPCQHSVRAYLSAGMHKGWALVTFFGGLSYVVALTPEFEDGDSRSFSLFYDTQKGAEFDPVVLHSEQEIIGRVLSPSTTFEQIEATDAQWYSIVEEYCRKNDLELSRIVS